MSKKPIIRCSGLDRLAKCTASLGLESAAPPEESSADATEGTMLHSVLAGFVPEKLTSEQERALDYCRRMETKTFAEVFGEKKARVTREIELEMELNNCTLTGHPDAIFTSPGKALVMDWKFGRNPVDPAEINQQLRGYALLVAEKFLAQEITVCIVQPRANLVTVCKYTAADIEAAVEDIQNTVWKCMAEQKPVTIPGESQCRYCRARATCPSLTDQSATLAIVDQNAITGDNAADLWRKTKLVEKHLGAIKSRIYLMVSTAEAEGRTIPGLTMKAGASRRTITDPTAAFNALASFISAEQFTSCCTVKIGELEEVFREKSGLKGNAAKEELTKRLGSCLEVKKSEASVVEKEVA
jgi:hypothetical protein